MTHRMFADFQVRWCSISSASPIGGFLVFNWKTLSREIIVDVLLLLWCFCEWDPIYVVTQDPHVCQSSSAALSVLWRCCIVYDRPTESKVRILTGDRDSLFDNRQISALELTYSFSKPKPGEIVADFCLTSSLLYENTFESQLWMLYDSNKRLIRSGDAYPNQVWSIDRLAVHINS